MTQFTRNTTSINHHTDQHIIAAQEQDFIRLMVEVGDRMGRLEQRVQSKYLYIS